MSTIDPQGRLVLDISRETFRKYVFTSGAALEIQKPMTLLVTREGKHRVTDGQGNTFCIPTYEYIQWQMKEEGTER